VGGAKNERFVMSTTWKCSKCSDKCAITKEYENPDDPIDCPSYPCWASWERVYTEPQKSAEAVEQHATNAKSGGLEGPEATPNG